MRNYKAKYPMKHRVLSDKVKVKRAIRSVEDASDLITFLYRDNQQLERDSKELKTRIKILDRIVWSKNQELDNKDVEIRDTNSYFQQNLKDFARYKRREKRFYLFMSFMYLAIILYLQYGR